MEPGLLLVSSRRQGSGPAGALSSFREGGCSLRSGPGVSHQDVSILGRGAARPCLCLPSALRPEPPLSYLLIFFFTQPFQFFTYQIFAEYLLALGLEVQQWTRADGAALTELTLHDPDGLKAIQCQVVGVTVREVEGHMDPWMRGT